MLINSIKKKENKGNKVINKEILKSVASDIITTTLNNLFFQNKNISIIIIVKRIAAHIADSVHVLIDKSNGIVKIDIVEKKL